MGLFGNKRKKKDEFEEMLVDMATGQSSQKAKSRGGHPVCPKCGTVVRL